MQVERLVQRYAGERLDAVVSANEQFGALAAAMVAQRLGLPHTDPRAILACQHKAYFRSRLATIAPEANVAQWPFPNRLQRHDPLGLPLPFYVKPVKATFSVLARRIDQRAQLHRHLRFAPWERLIIKRLVRPFNDAFVRLIGEPEQYHVDAHWLVAEALMSGEQINLDGYMFDGRLRLLGCVDELMYPGTDAFLRFRYPSALPDALVASAAALAERVLKGLGFAHGFFNVELFHDPRDGSLRIIEINPRLASQLADLYERVDGLPVFEMLLALAQGRDPQTLPRKATAAGVAASFVWRSFDAARPPPPADRRQLQWLAREHPDAVLLQYHKRGAGLAREYKWLGSHRYATLNLGAADERQLKMKYQQIAARLGWPAPY
jgi:hypothetical protein